MPYNTPRQSQGEASNGWQLPHTRGLALLLLAALAVLFILRFFYGKVSVEAGTR